MREAESTGRAASAEEGCVLIHTRTWTGKEGRKGRAGGHMNQGRARGGEKYRNGQCRRGKGGKWERAECEEGGLKGESVERGKQGEWEWGEGECGEGRMQGREGRM